MELTQQAEVNELSSAIANCLESKEKLTQLLLPYIVNGKIEYTKYPQLVSAKKTFFPIYVRTKYRASDNVLEAAQEALRLPSTSTGFQDALIDLVCNQQSHEWERGSAKYSVQTGIRKAFSTYWTRLLTEVEEHHKQARDLCQVRLLICKIMFSSKAIVNKTLTNHVTGSSTETSRRRCYSPGGDASLFF